MTYVLLDPTGDPIADHETGEVFVFLTEYDARQFARPGETIAGWIAEPGGPLGSKISVPVQPRDRR